MTDRLQMDPNLVSASRENLAKNKRTIRFLGDDLEVSASFTAPFDNGHFLAVNRMTSDRRDDLPAQTREFSGAPCEIELSNLSSCELPAQTHVRRIIFCHHKATTRLFVEPMHNARSQLPANAAQVPHMMQQGVDERSRPDSRTWMNDHSSRFVYHQKIFILEQDLQRNFFGTDVDRFRFGFKD
jgi:hypothetical protein